MLAFSALVVTGFGSFPKPDRSWLLASTGACTHQTVAAMGPVPAGYNSAIAFDFFPASTMAFTDAPFHQSEEIFGLGVEAEDLENSAWDYKNIALLEPVRAARASRSDCEHRPGIRLACACAQATDGSSWSTSVFKVMDHGQCATGGECVHCAPPAPRTHVEMLAEVFAGFAARSHRLGLRPDAQFCGRPVRCRVHMPTLRRRAPRRAPQVCPPP